MHMKPTPVVGFIIFASEIPKKINRFGKLNLLPLWFHFRAGLLQHR